MSALLPTLDLWRAAERDAEQAEHHWLAAMYSIDVDPALLEQRRAQLVEARKVAQALFTQAMRECHDVAHARRHSVWFANSE